MATTIGKLVVSLTTQTSKYQKGMKTSGTITQDFASGIGTATKAVAVFGVAAAAAAAVGVFKLIKSASAFEEISGKFTAVFKELTPEAKTFTNELAEELGRSRVQLTSFMATLQDTFVPLGFARKEGLQMSKTLTRLTIDLASFNDKAEPDVLRDLQSAIVGNHETMRKYGVIITQAGLSQELLNMGIRGGAKDATEAQKASARLNLILKGTTDAQGDALRTASGYANQVRRLKSNIEDITVALGTAFLPIAKDVVSRLNVMAKSFKAQTPAIAAWIQGIGEATIVTVDAIIDEISIIPDNFAIAGSLALDTWNTFLEDMEVGTRIWLADFKTGVDAIKTAAKSGFEKAGDAATGFLGKTTVAVDKGLLAISKGVGAKGAVKFFEKDLVAAQEIVAGAAILAAKGSDKAWDEFGIRTIKRTTDLNTEIVRIRQSSEALRKELAAKRGGLLGKEGGRLAKFLAKFKSIKFPKVETGLKNALVAGGEDAGKAIRKAITGGPAAIERGTVEAFSATVQPTFRAMSDNSKSTVAELKESNRLQREANRQFSAFAEGALVAEFV